MLLGATAGAAAVAVVGCGGSLERGSDPQVLNSVIYRVKRAGIDDPVLRASRDALPNADVRCGLLRDRRAMRPAASGPARGGDQFGCFTYLPAGTPRWIVKRDGSGSFTRVTRTAFETGQTGRGGRTGATRR